MKIEYSVDQGESDQTDHPGLFDSATDTGK